MTYKVIDKSVSAHCCFEATVVDGQGETICECFDVFAAKKICDALNSTILLAKVEEKPKKIGRFGGRHV